VVEMPVAEDERVDRRDIDAEQFKVVVEYVGRVAEVEQDAAADRRNPRRSRLLVMPMFPQNGQLQRFRPEFQ
jgi:hypothetical protein